MFAMEPTIVNWIKEEKLTNTMVKKKNFNLHEWILSTSLASRVILQCLEQSHTYPELNRIIFPRRKEDVTFVDISSLPKLNYITGPSCKRQQENI